jgi:hypothetical protein
MFRRSVACGVLCVITVGCGASTPTNEVGPSAITLSASDGDVTRRMVTQSIGSCPDGNAPSWLQTWTHGTTARLRWTEVAPVIDYHVIVKRYDVTNQYVPVENGDLWTHNTTWTELTLSEGRYLAQVQTMSCGKYMGPWSETLQFSVEGNDAGPAPDDPPAPPTESAEGTRVFPDSGQSLIDSTGAVWTFGIEVVPPFHQILRNGVFVLGWGTQLKYHNHGIYHSGGGGEWYLWNGSSWTDVGPTEP